MASSAIKDFEKTEKGCYNEIDFSANQIDRIYQRKDYGVTISMKETVLYI